MLFLYDNIEFKLVLWSKIKTKNTKVKLGKLCNVNCVQDNVI